MAPTQARHLIDRAVQIAKASRSVTAVIIPEDVQEAEYEDPPRAHGAVFSSVGTPADPRLIPPDERDPPRRRDPQRRREGRDPDRPGRPRRRRRGGRGRRPARRRRRQGAQRPRRPARRPALRHRPDRPARHEAELRDDRRLRHLPDDRLELPLRGVAARAGPGARRADRHRRPPGRHPLPDGGQPRRRRPRHAARADPAARAQGGPLLARGDRSRSRALVGDPRRAGDGRRATRSTRSGSSTSSARGCPTTASSPPTPARRPTGGRAT